MATELIHVFHGTMKNESVLLCNARDLHAFLHVGKRFASWITERITDYGFQENQDYILISPNRETKSGRGGDRRSKDYHLTLDTAKELAMVERNEQGRAVRRYFIECERKLNQQTTTTDDRTPLRDAVNMLVGKKGMMYPDAYTMIHQRFSVSHIEQLTQTQILEAIEYIHCLLLDDTSPTIPVFSFLITIKNGQVSTMRPVAKGEYLMTFDSFKEIAERAGYLVIHSDNLRNMTLDRLMVMGQKKPATLPVEF
ncbi:ORF6N domain-containing protein [Salmonella enterica subsp. enterica]|nr:ORF6N domain-containing protein [Salmonella enterica subsp. enterica]